MLTSTILRLVALLAIAGAAAPAAAQSASAWVQGPLSSVRLIAGNADGGVWRAGIEITLKSGAHTYWRSPGDSGVPPTFDFAGSTNLKSADVKFPAPKAMEEAGMQIFGYEGAVVFPWQIAAADPGKPVAIVLHLQYAACEKTCRPAEARLGGCHAELRALHLRLQREIAEAHHRITNNLQAVMSLIEMHKGEALDGFVSVEALNGSLLQIKTIALVHDLLSHKEAFNDVDTQMLLGNLVDLLAGSGIAARITLSADSVWLSTQAATSLALIVNELISNAHKHGTLGDHSDTLLSRNSSNDGISVRFWQHESSLVLEVDDSGPGFPMGFDVNQHANLGLALVQSLVENDLRGQLTFGLAPTSSGGSLPGKTAGGRVRIEFSAPHRT